MNRIRVLFADDHTVVGLGLATALKRGGIDFTRQITTLSELIPAFDADKPDVVMIDIRFGDTEDTGLDAAKALLHHAPTARVVVYSAFESDEIIESVYRLGCAAFVNKSTHIEDLPGLLKQVATTTEPVFQAHVSTRLIQQLLKKDSSAGRRDQRLLRQKLDEREFEVFRRRAYHFTYQEIADEFGLSTKTIRNITDELKRKLDVKHDSDLTALVLQYGVERPR